MHKLLMCFLLFLCSICAYPASSRKDRFALFLTDPPLAVAAQTRKDGAKFASEDHLHRIQASQQTLRQALAERKIRVISATQTLLNAVYIQAPGANEVELRNLPGVVRVVRMRPLRRHMNRALDLVNAPNAWTQVGGINNAGAGTAIAIVDTGIDHQHASFQDPSLRPPPGFPACAAADCAFTNNKIIAARSYVDSLVGSSDPATSRPDDLSPRDRVGHGTAMAMIAAGVQTTAAVGTASGVAPKAFLGNYKVFGSPGVNDYFTWPDILAVALEDAIRDGMHVAVMALGDQPAGYGPNDQNPPVACTDEPGTCDLLAELVRNTVAAGLTVIVSAGNNGDLGAVAPALNSINTPGTTPSAITVGATTNSHYFFSSLRVSGSGVPQNLTRIRAIFGNGPRDGLPLEAPMRDVAGTSAACEALGAGTLSNAIALIDEGGCAFSTKVNSAQKAGAVAAVIMRTNSDSLFPMGGLEVTGMPAALISATDARSLRAFLTANAGRSARLDPQLDEVNDVADTVPDFSSRGPAIGESHIKPDLVAVGTGLLVATQTYDPNGEMWNATGYTAAQGTSFAAALVAGAAALVKQAFPAYRPAQLKSALVNTADERVDEFNEQGALVRASITAMGAGKLNAAQAVRASVTAEPATLSFGVLGGSGGLPSLDLILRNEAATGVNLTFQVQPADARLQLSATSLAVGARASQQIRLNITQAPPPGKYEGFVVITGGGATLRIPYLYLRGNGTSHNALPLFGFDTVGEVNEEKSLAVKAVDQFGVPVRDVNVTFGSSQGTITDLTDEYGFADAFGTLGSTPGEQLFYADVPGVERVGFPARARNRPAISNNGVVDAASRQARFAPGSYIEIYGTSLSEATRTNTTAYLPLSLSDVSVSFDVPSRSLSQPARIRYVSEGLIVAQIPWELQGADTSQMKVSIGPFMQSDLYQLRLSRNAPAFFENPAGTVAALDEANALIGTANPVQRGRIAQLYANGLGPVDNTPPSGEPAPSTSLVNTVDRPTVTVGGVSANVMFSGLAPGIVGLNQVNIVVPESLQAGAHDVVLTIGGVSSKPVRISVR